MFLGLFISWWYGPGWRKALVSLKPRLHLLSENLSVKLLLSTLFAPWRRIVTYPGAGLNEKFKAFIDNFFSRFVGFIIRVLVLLMYLVASFVTIIFTGLEIIIWPLLPFIGVLFLVIGII